MLLISSRLEWLARSVPVRCLAATTAQDGPTSASLPNNETNISKELVCAEVVRPPAAEESRAESTMTVVADSITALLRQRTGVGGKLKGSL
jgi:hypothetical protein